MNSLSWNVRGIAAPGSKTLIVHTINKTHASIIGFQETKNESFSDSFLKSLIGHRNFSWNHLPTTGSAGGILMGVHIDQFDIISWDIRKFSVSCVLKHKVKKKEFRVTTVYASPYEEGKE